RVVGWSIDGAPTAALATNALGMAIDQRAPTKGAIIHSDHGTQFTSWAFTRRAIDCGLVPSMGSSSRLDAKRRRRHESSLLAPRNPGQARASGKPGAVHQGDHGS